MRNLKQFEDFAGIDPEGSLTEKVGISPAIYKDLQTYFTTSKKPSLSGARSFIERTKAGWKLSQEDFDEAKTHFKQ
jgi:hypothetical protein